MKVTENTNSQLLTVGGKEVKISSLKDLRGAQSLLKSFTTFSLAIENFVDANEGEDIPLGANFATFQNSLDNLPFDGSCQEMELKGVSSSDVDSLRKFLLTHALVVTAVNYSSNVDSQIKNKVGVLRTFLDDLSADENVETANQTNPSNQQEDLLILKKPFLMDYSTGFKVKRANGATRLELAFTVSGFVPYSELCKTV